MFIQTQLSIIVMISDDMIISPFHGARLRYDTIVNVIITDLAHDQPTHLDMEIHPRYGHCSQTIIRQ